MGRGKGEEKSMKIITISREFGSGGRELGRRLAEKLGWDYYDRQLITAIAQKEGLDPDYVEKMSDTTVWQNYPLTFQSSLQAVAAPMDIHTDILIAQRKVVREIADLGRDCVIVGRNADIVLRDRKPFTVFVCAEQESKLRRCRERASEGEDTSRKVLEKNMKRIDKARAQNHAMLSEVPWGAPRGYRMTVNSTDWDLGELAEAVAGCAGIWFRSHR